MAERRGRTGDAGIANENIELAMTFMQRRAEPRDALEIGEVERHQRGAAAVLADLVIELFEAALGPRHGDDVRAGLGQRAGGGIADAARSAGHESDAGGEGSCHRGNSVRGRPRERGDPYAVKVMMGEVSVYNVARTTDGRWLWVPAFAGTTRVGFNSPPPAATVAAAAVRPGYVGQRGSDSRR